MAAGTTAGQVRSRTTVDPATMNCSGEVTTASIPRDSYLISGEKSWTKIIFADNDLVYINRGADKGVNVGDQFRVVRPISDDMPVQWFRGQYQLARAMGQIWADLGTIKVLHVGPKTSTAEVHVNCDYMQRGDIIVPFQERPAPAFKADGFLVDPFAPAAGKTGTIVITKQLGEVAGNNDIVYVNIGSSQGVQVGSYLRIFRHQGNDGQFNYQTVGTEYKMYGFGSTPVAYTWEGLPREILGEGVVIRVSGNTATVMVTATRREIYLGDYVEVE
jgi:hypothetical protein